LTRNVNKRGGLKQKIKFKVKEGRGGGGDKIINRLIKNESEKV
jgi:cell division GTPase FtsZ